MHAWMYGDYSFHLFIKDEQTFDQYGIDWEGPVPLDSDTDEVVVPSVYTMSSQ